MFKLELGFFGSLVLRDLELRASDLGTVPRCLRVR